MYSMNSVQATWDFSREWHSREWRGPIYFVTSREMWPFSIQFIFKSRTQGNHFTNREFSRISKESIYCLNRSRSWEAGCNSVTKRHAGNLSHSGEVCFAVEVKLMFIIRWRCIPRTVDSGWCIMDKLIRTLCKTGTLLISYPAACWAVIRQSRT